MGLRDIHEQANGFMTEFAKNFKDGAKLTLIVRNPNFGPDADVIVTNDDCDKVIAAVQRLKMRETRKEGKE